jgi:hypothetical protein
MITAVALICMIGDITSCRATANTEVFFVAKRWCKMERAKLEDNLAKTDPLMRVVSFRCIEWGEPA